MREFARYVVAYASSATDGVPLCGPCADALDVAERVTVQLHSEAVAGDVCKDCGIVFGEEIV